MNWQRLISTLLTGACLAGCQGTAPEPRATVSPGDREEPPGAAASETVAMPVTDQPATSIRAKDADEFVPPFPENVDFFSPPPAPRAAAREMPQAASGTQDTVPQPSDLDARNIRVIGFVQVEGERPKAMLHVDGVLEIVSAGDRLGELTIVEIGPSQVRLKQMDQELTVGLPVLSEHEPRTAKRLPSGRASLRQTAWSQTPPGQRHHSAQPASPIDFSQLPTTPVAPAVELPEIDLPDVIPASGRAL